jgi:hypothetical protein
VAEAAQRGIDVSAAASLLPALLSDADPDTRGQAARALTYYLARVGGWAQLREILASTDVRLRLAASEALIRAEPADASLVEPLGVLLQDGEAEVRKTAAIAFSMWSKQGRRDYCSPALPALRSVAEHDDNDAVRQFAAQVVAATEGAS